MKIIEKLMEEHQLILKYAALVLEKTNAPLLTTNFASFELFVDFIQNFADAYHHSKEENILFIELNKPGVLSHCNPVGQMLAEHEQSRNNVREIKKGIETRNLEIVKTNAQNYCTLLQQHIYKEDNILYPMAIRELSDEQKASVDEAFYKNEIETKGLSVCEKYENLYNQLKNQFESVPAKTR